MDVKRQKREGIQRVDVAGKTPEPWVKLQPKLIAAINKLLDTTIDHNKGTTIRQETKEFTSAALDYLKARLKKDSIQNKKNEAEIVMLYERVEHERAKMNKTRAETRLLDAEADAKERLNIIRDLELALRLTKVIIAGEPGEEAILFGKKIDSYLEVIEGFLRSEQKSSAK